MGHRLNRRPPDHWSPRQYQTANPITAAEIPAPPNRRPAEGHYNSGVLAVEYGGVDWHSGPAGFVRDHRRRSALQEGGWTVLAIIAEDVRYRQWEMIRRIETQLALARAA